MKEKYTIALITLGYCLECWGALRKITHAADANTFLLAATICKVLGVLLLA
jgi:hypothetical protein